MFRWVPDMYREREKKGGERVREREREREGERTGGEGRRERGDDRELFDLSMYCTFNNIIQYSNLTFF